MTTDLMQEKDQLRIILKTKRAEITQQHHRDFSLRACDRLVDVILRADIESIGFFLPLKDEIDTRVAIEKLAKHGIQISLPITGKKATPLSFRHFTLGDRLEQGLFNTQQPLKNAKEIIPDLLIVPLLGFDEKGYRLGYGGGYYDCTIEKMSQNRAIKTVGFAFECQKCSSIPRLSHDKQLQMIVTEAQVYTCL